MLRRAIRSFSKVQPNPKTSSWFSSKLKCTSLTGFYGSNYYCTECEKGFKMDDAQRHRCLLPNTLPSLQARLDSSICSMSSMSVIFQQWMLLTPYCAHLRQSGYGSKQCLQNQEVMSQLQQNQQWQKWNQTTPMIHFVLLRFTCFTSCTSLEIKFLCWKTIVRKGCVYTLNWKPAYGGLSE